MLPTRGQRDGGFTASERYLARLCERSFLSLWSHPNLFRAPNKELSDLLVVFGEHVIVFSDKSCAFKQGEHGWSRWYRSAITDSASQLQRAAGWLRSHRDRVFMDVHCTLPFPFELPANPKLHLIAVALGAADACREHFGGGSGSLIVAPDADGTEPFMVGDLDPSKPFVHVLDETSLDLVMRELDTIDDFVRYFAAKEAFVRSGVLTSAAGEEELLAYYLQRTDETGRHAFIFDGNPTDVIIDELWSDFIRRPEYQRKKAADEVSFVWDGMIESVARCAAEGRLVAGNDVPLREHERGLRLLAAEPRVARRGLAKSLRDVFARSAAQDFYARYVGANDNRAHGYVLLTMKRRAAFRTEERYREFRRRTQGEDDGSIDMVMRTFDGWSEEDARAADDVRRKYGWSKGEGLAEIHGTEYEYPDPPEPPRTIDQRARRADEERARRAARKAQRAARKKSRR